MYNIIILDHDFDLANVICWKAWYILKEYQCEKLWGKNFLLVGVEVVYLIIELLLLI